MIIVRATVQGEPDVPAFTRVYEFGSADEEIFFSSAAMIEEKLKCSMKINANEALLLYCSHVAKSVRSGKEDDLIRKTAEKILSSENVMIGVPETLRILRFDATIDSRPTRSLVLNSPITGGTSLVAG
jgi:urease subunit gamma